MRKLIPLLLSAAPIPALAQEAPQIVVTAPGGMIDLDEARNLPCHTGVRLLAGSSHALGRVTPEKRIQLVRGDREVFGLRGRSAEQRVALDLLLDESVGIV